VYTPSLGDQSKAFGLNFGRRESASAGLGILGADRRLERSHRGGTVIIADGSNPATGETLTVAGWMGPWHAAWAFFYAPRNDSIAIQSMLDLVFFTDTPEGLVANAPGWDATRVQSTIKIDRIARVIVLDPIAARQLVPPWKGSEIPCGEVWRRREVEEGHEVDSLLIASSSSVAVVTAHSGSSTEAALGCVAQWQELSMTTDR
jgi:hypothetical protein